MLIYFFLLKFIEAYNTIYAVYINSVLHIEVSFSDLNTTIKDLYLCYIYESLPVIHSKLKFTQKYYICNANKEIEKELKIFERGCITLLRLQIPYNEMTSGVNYSLLGILEGGKSLSLGNFCEGSRYEEISCYVDGNLIKMAGVDKMLEFEVRNKELKVISNKDILMCILVGVPIGGVILLVFMHLLRFRRRKI